MTYIKKQILPALHESAKVKKPDLANIGNQNYTSTILKYGNLSLPFPQLDTTAKTIVAAINELYARHGGHSGSGGGSIVIPNPLVGNDIVLGTDTDDYIVTNLDYYIQVYQGEPAGLLYAVSIDGYIYDIENVSECDIDDLKNVDISGATDGQILQYNAETLKWKNVDSSIFIPSLGGLTDVDIDGPQGGQALIYDDTSGDWVNGMVSTVGELNDLTDVNITDVTGGQVLKYDQDSGQWVNADDASGISRLDELTDVDIVDPVANQFLRYDGTEWINSTVENNYVWEGTQAEYDAITEKDPDTVYYITDGATVACSADEISYDNTTSSLSATDVQSAIDEIATSGGASSLSGLNDVTIDTQTLSNGQNLTYDSSASKWINHTIWTDLTATLVSGATSLTIQNSVITTTSTIEVFADNDIDYNSITVTTGQIMLTFDAQAGNIGIKVRVS